MAPGQRECDRAIEELRILFQEVDKALTNVESLHKTDKSLQVNYSFILKSNPLFSSIVSSRTNILQFSFSNRINYRYSSIIKT